MDNRSVRPVCGRSFPGLLRSALASLFLIASVPSGTLQAVPSTNREYFDIVRSIDLLGEVYQEVSKDYVDKVNVSELMYAGIDGMLHTLDPYTVFLDEDASKDFGELTSGHYPGIGVSIASIDGRIYVTSTVEGYPASKNGIKVGDRIVSINSRNIGKLSLEEVKGLIKGPSGSSITIRIERQGMPVFSLKLLREEVRVNSVSYSGLIDGIGYIEMKNFGTRAAEDLREAYQALRTEASGKKVPLRGLILDLRNNPGGLLDVAVDVTSLFVRKGSEVVSIKGRLPKTSKSYATATPPLDASLPLAILINNETASAAEIVSGAIQDLDRGVIIGGRSFGKGLVQSVIRVSYGHTLKLTTAKYYTPSGRLIQKELLDEGDRSTRKVLPGTGSEKTSRIFYTSGKRKVYGGGGISPDIEVAEPVLSPYLSELRRKGMLFLFSAGFRSTNASMPSMPLERKGLMASFGDFIRKREFTFRTESEQRFNELKESLEQERPERDEGRENCLSLLRQQIDSIRETEIAQESDKVAAALEVEILRHYSERLARMAELDQDPAVRKALEVLTDSHRYSSLLHL
ncbi:MAG: S41 family peptidase [Chlorobiaceae bacterium]|nr:S41 family peptidase [Chlorobiaceae bacterium]NTV59913.1 S41 family peptidase [Chlorobiaceae bacterium]